MDAPNLYEIPLALHEEGLDDYVCRLLGLRAHDGSSGTLDLSAWEALVARVEAAVRPVRIGLIGKYVNLPDAYLSVVEALRHGGYAHGAKIDLEWIQAEEVEGLLADGRLRDLDGIVIPGGFGERGIEGKIAAATYARENEIPCLGLCLGLQVMVIEYARNVVGLAGANSREFDAASPHLVIDLMDEQREVVDDGRHHAARGLPGPARSRARSWPSRTAPSWSTSATATATRSTPATGPASKSAGLVCSGDSPDDRLVEFIELPGHPFWVGHPGPPGVQEPTRQRPSAVRGPGRRRAAPSRGPVAPSARRRRPCRRSVSSARPRSSAAPLVTVASAEFEGPDGERFERDVVHHPGRGGRGAVHRGPSGDHGAPVPGRGRRRAARDSGRQAGRRRRADRDDRSPASWPRKSGAGPVGWTCWPASTTPRASPTSSPGCTWPETWRPCPSTARGPRSST